MGRRDDLRNSINAHQAAVRTLSEELSRIRSALPEVELISDCLKNIYSTHQTAIVAEIFNFENSCWKATRKENFLGNNFDTHQHRLQECISSVIYLYDKLKEKELSKDNEISLRYAAINNESNELAHLEYMDSLNRNR